MSYINIDNIFYNLNKLKEIYFYYYQKINIIKDKLFKNSNSNSFNYSENDINLLIENINDEIFNKITSKDFSIRKFKAIFQYKNLIKILVSFKDQPKLQEKILDLKEEIFLNLNFQILNFFVDFKSDEDKLKSNVLIEKFLDIDEKFLVNFSNKLYYFFNYKFYENNNINQKINKIKDRINFIFYELQDPKIILFLVNQLYSYNKMIAIITYIKYDQLSEEHRNDLSTFLKSINSNIQYTEKFQTNKDKLNFIKDVIAKNIDSQKIMLENIKAFNFHELKIT